MKNICKSFTHKMAAKASWHWNDVTVTLCILSVCNTQVIQLIWRDLHLWGQKCKANGLYDTVNDFARNFAKCSLIVNIFSLWYRWNTLCWQASDRTYIFTNQHIECCVKNTINLRPSTPHISPIPCYTHKMTIVPWPSVTSLHMYSLSRAPGTCISLGVLLIQY